MTAALPSARSPEQVQISTAAAITLGYQPGRMHRVDCTHCLNVLLTYPEGCRANCAYCGLARHREQERAYAERNFIRVDWPTVPFARLVEDVKAGKDKGAFERMCLSMITHPDSQADTLALLRAWVAALPHIPVSILSNPSTMVRQDLVDLKEAGTDIFTVALDAATPELFRATRGEPLHSPHRWEKYWQVLGWAAELFGPERFGAHLICGLGESERDMLETVQRVRDLGGHSHLFAFFPERGSLLADRPAVDADQWRRVQLGRYLIDYAGARVEGMAFDVDGRLIGLGATAEPWHEAARSGLPFRTSGCPGRGDPRVSACNRPYGDSAPSAIRSYPFALKPEDVTRVWQEGRLDGLASEGCCKNTTPCPSSGSN